MTQDNTKVSEGKLNDKVSEEGKLNDTEKLVIEHTFKHLIECHAHMHSLTKTVVSLNVAVIAAAILFFRFKEGMSLSNNFWLENIILMIFGFLIICFGWVFNWGAASSFNNLVVTVGKGKEFLEKSLPAFDSRKLFLDKIVTVEKTLTYPLTIAFFIICIMIWVAFGGSLMYEGLKALILYSHNLNTCCNTGFNY